MATEYLIIGSGRAAQHCSHYFSLLDIPYHTWNRGQADEDLLQKVRHTKHILVLISDRAIESFVQKHLQNVKAKIIHFSGALEIPGTTSAHPLMTFGPKLEDLSFYRQIPFVLTTEQSLAEILPDLPNPFFRIPADKKSYYHALCVLSGNFTTLLWQKFFDGLRSLGLPREAGEPYLNQVIKNTLNFPETALTGPLARRDRLTIEKNLEAMKHDPFHEVYRAFVKTQIPEWTDL